MSSLQNPRVQAARRLHRRVARDREHLFLLEGPVVVAEALSAGIALTDVFVASDSFGDDDLLDGCANAGASVMEVGDNVLRAVAATATPQGVVAVARMPSLALADLPDSADLVLVLAEVRDPGNAGTLVRTAVAAGAGCVVFIRGSTDPYGAKTVRASAGSIFKVPIVRSVDMDEVVAALNGHGYRTVGARADASTAIYDAGLAGRIAVVLGNEAWGFERDDLGLHEWVSIPINEKVESLNVATAGAIILFEVVRQRRLSSPRHG